MSVMTFVLAQEEPSGQSSGLLSFSLLVLILGVILTGLFWGKPRRITARRSGRFFVAVRIGCAVAGAAILVVVGVVTWQQARGFYASRAQEIPVHVPTQEGFLPPSGQEDVNGLKAQYLVDLVIAEFGPAGVTPLAVHEFRVWWPEGKGRTYEAAISAGGLRAKTSFAVTSVGWEPAAGPDEPSRIELRGSFSHSVSYGSVSSSASDDMTGSGRIGGELPGVPSVGRNELSLTRRRLATVHAFYLVTPAPADDPLETASADELLRRHSAAIEKMVQEQQALALPDPFAELSKAVSGGLRLVWLLGLTGMLLSASVLLLAQAFPRRSLATVVLTLFVVLYVAALDRAVLGHNLSRLADAQAPIEERLTACAQATDTFFFRKTALKHVEVAAQDENSPSELRSLAEHVRTSLGK